MVNFEKRELKHGFAGIGGLAPGMIIGLLLILGGTLLFLDNLNLLPFETARAFWPFVLIAYSAAYVRSRSAATRVWAVTGVVAGVLLLLGKYHVLRVSGDILWPLFLIATGIVMVIYRLRWQRFTSRFQIGSSSETHSTTIPRLEEFALFSSVKRKVETPGFEGAELTSVFGSIEIDMRWAAISTPNRQAVIEANAAFGSIELRIPDTWKVRLEGNAIFGSYEDKTIPPRPGIDGQAPTLLIRGGTAFGSVQVHN